MHRSKELELNFTINVYGKETIVRANLEVYMDSVTFYYSSLISGDTVKQIIVDYFYGDLYKTDRTIYPHEIILDNGSPRTIEFSSWMKPPYTFYGKRKDNGNTFAIMKE